MAQVCSPNEREINRHGPLITSGFRYIVDPNNEPKMIQVNLILRHTECKIPLPSYSFLVRPMDVPKYDKRTLNDVAWRALRIFYLLSVCDQTYICRDPSGYGPSQRWETTLHCNVVYNWLSLYTEWSLTCINGRTDNRKVGGEHGLQKMNIRESNE